MDSENMFINRCESILKQATDAINEEASYETINTGSFIFPKYEKKIKFPKNEEFRENICTEQKRKIYNDIDYLSFMILWEYSEFIRWCEKLFFYTNNPTDSIYSDTPIDSIDSRSILFNEENYDILVIMKMSKKADFDSKEDKLKFHNVIEIKINRHYGKEIKNKYTIVDGVSRCNNSSDAILLDIVTRTINTRLQAHYEMILDKIKKYVLHTKIGNK